MRQTALSRCGTAIALSVCCCLFIVACAETSTSPHRGGVGPPQFLSWNYNASVGATTPQKAYALSAHFTPCRMPDGETASPDQSVTWLLQWAACRRGLCARHLSRRGPWGLCVPLLPRGGQRHRARQARCLVCRSSPAGVALPANGGSSHPNVCAEGALSRRPLPGGQLSRLGSGAHESSRGSLREHSRVLGVAGLDRADAPRLRPGAGRGQRRPPARRRPDDGRRAAGVGDGGQRDGDGRDAAFRWRCLRRWHSIRERD